MKHLLMGVYQVNSNKSPGVIGFPYMCIVKTLENLLLKTPRARA
jgi:hypothetical protein